MISSWGSSLEASDDVANNTYQDSMRERFGATKGILTLDGDKLEEVLMAHPEGVIQTSYGFVNTTEPTNPRPARRRRLSCLVDDRSTLTTKMHGNVMRRNRSADFWAEIPEAPCNADSNLPNPLVHRKGSFELDLQQRISLFRETMTVQTDSSYTEGPFDSKRLGFAINHNAMTMDGDDLEEVLLSPVVDRVESESESLENLGVSAGQDLAPSDDDDLIESDKLQNPRFSKSFLSPSYTYSSSSEMYQLDTATPDPLRSSTIAYQDAKPSIQNRKGSIVSVPEVTECNATEQKLAKERDQQISKLMSMNGRDDFELIKRGPNEIEAEEMLQSDSSEEKEVAQKTDEAIDSFVRKTFGRSSAALLMRPPSESGVEGGPKVQPLCSKILSLDVTGPQRCFLTKVDDMEKGSFLTSAESFLVVSRHSKPRTKSRYDISSDIYRVHKIRSSFETA